MDIYDVISKQIDSYQEQEKEVKSNRQDRADFLRMANTLITIDSYIKILDEGKYVDSSAIDKLNEAWEALKRNGIKREFLINLPV